MTPERAQEIVSAINDRYFYKLELVKTAGSLKGVSLAEMLEAKTLVDKGYDDPKTGNRILNVIPDDRLIAAAYVLENYHTDRDAICIIPHEDFGWDLKCVAVVGLDREQVEGEAA